MIQNHRESGRTYIRSVDWTIPRTLVVVLGVLTSSIHVYLGLSTGEIHFVILGMGLLAGVVIFVTKFWQPVLYLLGVIYVTVLLVLWILEGTGFSALGLIDAVVQIGLITLFLYLFADSQTLTGK